jgi:hypothetical protein
VNETSSTIERLHPVCLRDCTAEFLCGTPAAAEGAAASEIRSFSITRSIITGITGDNEGRGGADVRQTEPHHGAEHFAVSDAQSTH